MGDFSKIPALLSASIIDKTNGIKFINQETGKGTSPGLVNTGWVEESGKRIALQVYLAVTSFNFNQSIYYFYHEIYVLNQEKNWLGSWKFTPAETWINATWTMRVFYNDIVSFSNSWSYHSYDVTDFKACINPETGGNPPYRTLFSVTSPYPDIDDELWQPYWDWNYTTFTAVRIGGQAGITATIPYR